MGCESTFKRVATSCGETRLGAPAVIRPREVEAVEAIGLALAGGVEAGRASRYPIPCRQRANTVLDATTARAEPAADALPAQLTRVASPG